MLRRVYGPVPSRRFGSSLGVDPVPLKHCSYDCVFCQLGRTTHHETDRTEFFPPERIVEDVRWALDRGPTPDVITFAGSGEPTLYSALGQVVRTLRGTTTIPLLLITNGSLLWREDVAADARLFDWVAPTLSAVDADTFKRINGPKFPVPVETVLAGIEEFTRTFAGKVLLEVFLVRGVNDSPEMIRKLAGEVRRIRPARVDLNTAVRPAPGTSAHLGVEAEVLAEILPTLQMPPVALHARAEVLRFAQDDGCLTGSDGGSTPSLSRGEEGIAASALLFRILSTLRRRPCTLGDLSRSLGAGPGEVEAAAAALLRDGQVVEREEAGAVFLVAVSRDEPTGRGS